ncbi:UNVERIFIED_CONTAM: Small GTPase LIP1 [Sesamum angustifolium]|uniref:Small GTPase LIP1 n=1 Tax=Sesamum angustifolium TaxID=2727405 RepID=A0AAW2IJ10_9LAMI
MLFSTGYSRASSWTRARARGPSSQLGSRTPARGNCASSNSRQVASCLIEASWARGRALSWTCLEAGGASSPTLELVLLRTLPQPGSGAVLLKSGLRPQVLWLEAHNIASDLNTDLKGGKRRPQSLHYQEIIFCTGGGRKMFWRDRERETKEQNGGPPVGQIRVLVVGDSGCYGVDHLILNEIVWINITQGRNVIRLDNSGVQEMPVIWEVLPLLALLKQLVVTVSVKHTAYGNSGSSSSSMKGDAERDFLLNYGTFQGMNVIKIAGLCFILKSMEVFDLFYIAKLDDVEFVFLSLNWDFSAPLGSGGPGGLPVPYVVIGNKADIASKEGTRGSSGNLVDIARQWVEKQGLLPSSEELPLTESFPSGGGLLAAAKEARYDKEAVMKFFRMLIRRRYFSDELPGAAPWSAQVNRPLPQSGEIVSDDDQQYRNLSLSGDPYKYNILPPFRLNAT